MSFFCKKQFITICYQTIEINRYKHFEHGITFNLIFYIMPGGMSKLLFENIKKRFFRVVSNQKSKKKPGGNIL
jgi:hypothetical protein